MSQSFVGFELRVNGKPEVRLLLNEMTGKSSCSGGKPDSEILFKGSYKPGMIFFLRNGFWMN